MLVWGICEAPSLLMVRCVQMLALKTANKRQLNRSVGSFRLEVEILQRLNHKNIIKVFEIIDDPNSQVYRHSRRRGGQAGAAQRSIS